MSGSDATTPRDTSADATAAGPKVRTLGGPMARRQLHVIYILDRSGSMNANGKIQSLNVAMIESLPLLREAALDNVTADVFVRVLLFSDGARWVTPEATPVEKFRWTPVDADGLTDLGAALELLAPALESPPMPERALPPVLVLVSDGQPTDDYRAGLARVLASTFGARALRLAVAIGRDADLEVLQEFIGTDSDLRPVQADEPDAVIDAIRWASTAATNAAAGTMVRAPSDELDDDVFVPPSDR